MKKRKRVKQSLDKLSITDLVAHGQKVSKKLGGDTRFDSLDSDASKLDKAVADLEKLNTDYDLAVKDCSHKLLLRDNKRGEVEALLTVLGSGVEHLSEGSTEFVVASGFDVQAPRKTVGPLPAPQNLVALMADLEGQIRLRWNRVKGAKSYVIEYTPDGSNNWTHAGVTTKASFNLSGLESGKRYRIRVRAIGTAGPGPWSDEAVKMAA
jgi:hypothetical protein